MNLGIELTEKEVYYLKQYARLFAVEREIDYTRDPIVCVEEKQKPIAFFLTRKEAERYCRYQGHNLKNSRVYSRYVGYGNDGDLECLMKFMRRIGSDLLAQDKEKVE